MTVPNNDEQRQSHRRTVRDAAIVVDPHKSPIPCVVLDRSPGGFRLHVHLPAEVPDRFKLRVATDIESHDCEVVWRRDNEIGAKVIND